MASGAAAGAPASASPPGEAADEGPEVFASKSITLGQLLYFYRKFEQLGKITPTTTCREVLQGIILPETAAQRCCYADLLLGARKQARTLLCHWSGASFREVVLCCAQHASGLVARPDLERKAFGPGSQGFGPADSDKAYWICMFAANHHLEHRLGDNARHDDVVRHMQDVAVALDPELAMLRRTWCLGEMGEAVKTDKAVNFFGHLEERLKQRLKESEPIELPGLADSEAGDLRDKNWILQHISATWGLKEFDAALGDAVQRGLRGVVLRRAMREGDMDTAGGVLRSGLVSADAAHGKYGETVLVWAVQNGSQELFQSVVESRADPNIACAGGWTALHYAVQLRREGFVEALLEARADPDAATLTGRTPIMEASERDFRQLFKLLRLAGADQDRADVDGLSARGYEQERRKLAEQARLEEERADWRRMRAESSMASRMSRQGSRMSTFTRQLSPGFLSRLPRSRQTSMSSAQQPSKEDGGQGGLGPRMISYPEGDEDTEYA